MSSYYRTKANETLDWICWQYYVKEVSLGSAAMAVDPRLLGSQEIADSGFLLNPNSDEAMRGAVEKVLQANPGLAAYPLNLPAGLNILLPDLTPDQVQSDTVKLWE